MDCATILNVWADFVKAAAFEITQETSFWLNIIYPLLVYFETFVKLSLITISGDAFLTKFCSDKYQTDQTKLKSWTK